MTIELEVPTAITTAGDRVPAPKPGRPVAGYARAVLRPVVAVLRRPGLLIAWAVLLVAVGWALFPSLFTSYSPYEGNPDASFAPPSWTHLFGTDRLGRDLFARSVYGAGTTLSATLLAVLIAFGVGTLIGLLAGFLGGVVDVVVMRVVDVFLAIPSLLLAMVIVSVLGYSTNNIAIAVGVGSIAAFARVMRAEVLAVKTHDYVRAAYGLGVRRFGVVVRHIVPNAVSSVLALGALEIGTATLAVAGLGFLGYGAPPPKPEWGLLVAEGRDFIAVYPWISLLPGAALALVVIATHRISTSFRKDHG